MRINPGNIMEGLKKATKTSRNTDSHVNVFVFAYTPMLLVTVIRGGILRSVPCIAVIFWSMEHPRLSYNHSLFNHQRSLANTSSESEETWPEWRWILPTKYIFHWLIDCDDGVRLCLRNAASNGYGPSYPLDRRLGGPQSWSGRRGCRKNSLPLPGFELQSSSL
jgi:hypothetical protein